MSAADAVPAIDLVRGLVAVRRFVDEALGRAVVDAHAQGVDSVSLSVLCGVSRAQLYRTWLASDRVKAAGRPPSEASGVDAGGGQPQAGSSVPERTLGGLPAASGPEEAA